MNPVLFPWIAEIGLMTYRSMTGQRFALTRNAPGVTGPFALGVVKSTGPKRPPLPSELIATYVVFGGASMLGESSNPNTRRIGSLIAWGLVLATGLMMAGGGTPTLPQGSYPNTAVA
jgi:hypothetical protein